MTKKIWQNFADAFEGGILTTCKSIIREDSGEYSRQGYQQGVGMIYWGEIDLQIAWLYDYASTESGLLRWSRRISNHPINLKYCLAE